MKYVLKIEAVITKTEINNEWNINFLQSCPHDTQCTYSSDFLIG